MRVSGSIESELMTGICGGALIVTLSQILYSLD